MKKNLLLATIDETAIYITPEEEVDLSLYATTDYVDIRVPSFSGVAEGSVLCIVNGAPTWAIPSLNMDENGVIGFNVNTDIE